MIAVASVAGLCIVVGVTTAAFLYAFFGWYWHALLNPDDTDDPGAGMASTAR